jgi:hypothetical protein
VEGTAPGHSLLRGMEDLRHGGTLQSRRIGLGVPAAGLTSIRHGGKLSHDPLARGKRNHQANREREEKPCDSR